MGESVSLATLALAAACDCPTARAARWVDSINATLAAFGIDTPRRGAAFLAQVAHESGRLFYVRELWGPTSAQVRYEGRRDLGNLRPGDGKRFMGRGLIQVTGRANYRACRDGLREALPKEKVPDFELSPELLELPKWATFSAGWYWRSRKLSELADDGTPEGFILITKRINGGLNGLDDRRALWAKAKAALGA